MAEDTDPAKEPEIPLSGPKTEEASGSSRVSENLPSGPKVAENSDTTKVPPPASTAMKAPGRRDPQRRAFVTRRAALRILERLKGVSEKDLPETDKSSLDWARGVLADPKYSSAQMEKSSSSLEVPKRQRSVDESFSHPSTSKRPKHKHTVVDRPYSEIARNPLIRAIIDRNACDGAISHDKWVTIRQSLLGVFWKVLQENPGPAPQNDDAGWFQKHIKLLACTNERSAHLLELAVRSLGELWPGAKLDAVPVCEIPRRPRSIGVFPAEPHEPAAILDMLQTGNPGLPTHDWKVARVSGEKNRMREVVVILNKESLEPLRKRKGYVYYGFASIRLNIYRGDDKADTDTSAPATEVPPGDGLAAGEGIMEVVDDSTCPAPEVDSECEKAEESPLEMESEEDEGDLLASQPDDSDVTIVNYDSNLDDDEGDPN